MLGGEAMDMKERIRLVLFFSLFSFVLGCAHGPVIAPDVKEKIDPSVTMGKIRSNPDAYKGKMVLWGGEVLQVIPEGTNKTLIEVSQMGLDRKQRPDEKAATGDQFFVLMEGERDFSQFERGRKITVAGDVMGTLKGKGYRDLSGLDETAPVILGRSVHVWKERAYSYSNAPDERGSWEYRHYSGILRY